MYTYPISETRAFHYVSNDKTARTIPLFDGLSSKGNPVDARLSVIYGQNGSGKSSIAKALTAISNEGSNPDNHLMDDDRNAITPDERKQQSDRNIHVFNEAFINENVQFRDKGLESIVLLGEQVDLQQRIEEIQDNIQKYRQEREQEQYEPAYHEPKLKKYTEDLRKGFKRHKGWKSREESINRSSKAIFVKEKVLATAFRHYIEESESASTLTNKFNELLEIHKRVEKSSSLIQQLPNLANPYNHDLVNAYITTPPPIHSKKDDSTERDRLNTHHPGKSQMERLLKIVTTDQYCPTCLRDFTPDYKEHMSKLLADEISERENSESMDHSTLQKDAPRIPSVAEYTALDDKTIGLLNRQQEKITKYHQEINETLQARAEYGAEGCRTFNSLTDDPYPEYQTLIEDANRQIARWNSTVKNQYAVEEELRDLNLRIAAFEASSHFSAYFNDCCSEIEKYNRFNARERLMSDLEKELTETIAKQQNITEAIDTINSHLRLVFFSDDRIQLVPEDGFYRIKSRGSAVDPRMLSTGERNIIAIAYFFTSIYAGRRQGTFLDSGHLTVLDDPISSFDFDNRYGVTCLIANELGKLLEERSNRAIVLTHDLGVASDMRKILVDTDSLCTSTWSISPDRFERFEPDSFDVYSSILKRMYAAAQLAKTQPPERIVDTPVAGNEIRRALESFSRFVLGENVSSVTQTALVVDAIDDDRLQSAFQQPMIRLVIHPESHGSQQLLVDNFRLESTASAAELSRIAFELLCFMHYVAPFHVPSRLAEKKAERRSFKSALDDWLERLKEGRAFQQGED